MATIIYCFCLAFCVQQTLAVLSESSPLVDGPRAQQLRAAGAKCRQRSELLANIASEEGYLKCLVTELGLWSDGVGYDAGRVVEMLAEHEMPHEIAAVVEYCNRTNRQEDLHKWAYLAYRCATSGTIGVWVKKYVNTIYENQP